jgi:hypothetical protein
MTENLLKHTVCYLLPANNVKRALLDFFISVYCVVYDRCVYTPISVSHLMFLENLKLSIKNMVLVMLWSKYYGVILN